MNIVNGPCAVLAIMSCATACTTPAPTPAAVRVTTTSEDVAGCNLLGKVIVADTAADPAEDARRQTRAVGGNVLLRKNDVVWNGNAYQCPGSH